MSPWEAFLEQILSHGQILVLRYALKNHVPVHFYGTGIGKTTIAHILRACGFEATAPENILSKHEHGAMTVPNNGEVVCINVKKQDVTRRIPGLKDALLQKDQENISAWVSRLNQN